MKWTLLLALLLILYDKEALAAGSTSTEKPEEDLGKFEHLEPSTHDCNMDATRKSIAFLQGKKKAHPTVDEMRTDLTKLRNFLEKKDFINKPGSLFFYNWQDTTITLHCGKASGKIVWSVESAIPGYDKKFNAEYGSSPNELRYSAAGQQITYKRFNCEAEKPKKCNHTIYAFTRPLPITDYPLFYHDGDPLDIKCQLNKCIYSNEKSGSCKFPFPDPPVVAHPYTFSWAFPGNDDSSRFDLYNTNRKIYKANEENPLKLKISTQIYNGTFQIRTATDKGTIDVTKPVIQTSLRISKVETKHDGVFECIIVNSYGIPSTPVHDSLHEETRFRGKAFIHVRSLTWTFIALGLFFGLLVLALLMNWLCSSTIEVEESKPEPESRQPEMTDPPAEADKDK